MQKASYPQRPIMFLMFGLPYGNLRGFVSLTHIPPVFPLRLGDWLITPRLFC